MVVGKAIARKGRESTGHVLQESRKDEASGQAGVGRRQKKEEGGSRPRSGYKHSHLEGVNYYLQDWVGGESQSAVRLEKKGATRREGKEARKASKLQREQVSRLALGEAISRLSVAPLSVSTLSVYAPDSPEPRTTRLRHGSFSRRSSRAKHSLDHKEMEEEGERGREGGGGLQEDEDSIEVRGKHLEIQRSLRPREGGDGGFCSPHLLQLLTPVLKAARKSSTYMSARPSQFHTSQPAKTPRDTTPEIAQEGRPLSLAIFQKELSSCPLPSEGEVAELMEDKQASVGLQ